MQLAELPLPVGVGQVIRVGLHFLPVYENKSVYEWICLFIYTNIFVYFLFQSSFIWNYIILISRGEDAKYSQSSTLHQLAYTRFLTGTNGGLGCQSGTTPISHVASHCVHPKCEGQEHGRRLKKHDRNNNK